MNESLPVLSIIIPVWNPGPTVERCVESMRAQTLKDIEIIFIDDCGTDSAMEIIRAAAGRDARIRIITNPENIGSGPSRNRGIEAARGKYLAFADPDDYVDPDFYGAMVRKAEETGADIVKGILIPEREDGTTSPWFDRRLNAAIRRGLSQGKPLFLLFTYEHHSGLYRRDLVLKNGARYGKSKRAQDVTFLLKACMYSKRFAFADGGSRYHFCERADSAMHNKSAVYLMGFLDMLREQAAFLAESPADPDDAGEYILHSVHSCLVNAVLLEEAQGNADEYLRQLRLQAEKLPFADEACRSDIRIKALLKDQTALPGSTLVLPWERPTVEQCEKLIRRWKKYLKEHPECRRIWNQGFYGVAAWTYLSYRRAVGEGLAGRQEKRRWRKAVAEAVLSLSLPFLLKNALKMMSGIIRELFRLR